MAIKNIYARTGILLVVISGLSAFLVLMPRGAPTRTSGITPDPILLITGNCSLARATWSVETGGVYDVQISHEDKNWVKLLDKTRVRSWDFVLTSRNYNIRVRNAEGGEWIEGKIEACQD